MGGKCHLFSVTFCYLYLPVLTQQIQDITGHCQKALPLFESENLSLEFIDYEINDSYKEKQKYNSNKF